MCDVGGRAIAIVACGESSGLHSINKEDCEDKIGVDGKPNTPHWWSTVLGVVTTVTELPVVYIVWIKDHVFYAYLHCIHVVLVLVHGISVVRVLQ